MILDTNAVSALLAGDRGVGAVLANSARHHLPAVVLGEYRFGLKTSRRRKTIEKWLNRLEEESVVLVVDAETAKCYADVRHGLKSKGRPIPENDVWIAALALQHDLPVVTRDEHFDDVDSLRRVSWQPAG